MNFNETISNKKIIKAIEEMGFTGFSEIQKATIPLALANNDIVGQAQTGTGKTASFVIPILNDLVEEQKTIQALIVVPTRELAIQVTNDVLKIGKYLDVRSMTVYGGEPVERQLQGLKKNPQIVVGTPGRIIDLINRNKLKLKNINYFVLDEMDEMLNMGFIDDVEEILTHLPEDHQNLFFSATLPPRIKNITKKYTRNPQFVTISEKSMTVEKVKQHYMEVKDSERLDQLNHILQMRLNQRVIIFTQTKRAADQITSKLLENSFAVDKIHGDIPQQTRTTTMNRYRHDKFKILVATDVLARGIDVDGIDLVINYGLSQEMEYYIHRIGRTGRGNSVGGEAITLVTPNEYRKEFKHYARLLKTEINKMEKPSPKMMSDQLKLNYLAEITNHISTEKIKKEHIEFTNDLLKLHQADEIIAYLVSKIYRDLEPKKPSSNSGERKSDGGRNRRSGGGDRDRNSRSGSGKNSRYNRDSRDSRSGFSSKSKNSNFKKKSNMEFKNK